MGTADIGPRANFVRSVSRHSEQINLALSCLYIAEESCPDLDVPAYMGKISEISERIRQRSQVRNSLFDALYALNDLMFKELGFSGNAGNYYDIKNSLLNEVLDRRLGIPITLSILYMEIGRRVGIQLTGVNMSGTLSSLRRQRRFTGVRGSLPRRKALFSLGMSTPLECFWRPSE